MPTKEWNPQNAVAAFTAALSRSGYDQAYRDRLKASLESAREAVSEAGDINIPDDIVIVFYEDQLKSTFNEKYHAFYLPTLDPDSTDVHQYQKHFQGFYNAWRPEVPKHSREWLPENAVPALTGALSRSGHDSDFRTRLKASLESAREAVSEEGEIDIPNDIVFVFHEDKVNEKYHAFYLPKFDPDKTDVRHEYVTYRKLKYAWPLS